MKTGNMLLARMIEDKNCLPWQNKGKMDIKAQESKGTQFQDLYILLINSLLWNISVPLAVSVQAFW